MFQVIVGLNEGNMFVTCSFAGREEQPYAKTVPSKSAFSKNSICLVTLVSSKHSFSHREKVRYQETTY